MTSLQDDRVKEYESDVNNRGGNAVTDWRESNSSESRGVLFGEVDGITLVVYPNGLISIPAVRTYHPPNYPTPVIAAASAKELWARQKARDDAQPDLAKSRRTGHLGPIVNHEWECQNEVCPCHRENPGERQRRARGGHNTNPDQCS
jgi:hypothetical protein